MGKGADIAAQSLFTAASAANAIPVAGQFVSAGLAIAGLFTKIFGGRRQAKKEAARKAREARVDTAKAATVGQADAGGGMGQLGSGTITTAPVQAPQAPAFNSYGGGSAPTIQPVQQALNSSIGLK